MPNFPTFPRRGEPWFECFICGFAFPTSEGIVHYKSKKLVCSKDNDLPTHSDYQELLQRPMEHTDVTPQKVQD